MAIKISGTTVVDDDRNLININDLTASGNVSINSIDFPTVDGPEGTVLTTDGSGTLSFKATGVPAYSAF